MQLKYFFSKKSKTIGLQTPVLANLYTDVLTYVLTLLPTRCEKSFAANISHSVDPRSAGVLKLIHNDMASFIRIQTLTNTHREKPTNTYYTLVIANKMYCGETKLGAWGCVFEEWYIAVSNLFSSPTRDYSEYLWRIKCNPVYTEQRTAAAVHSVHVKTGLWLNCGFDKSFMFSFMQQLSP